MPIRSEMPKGRRVAEGRHAARPETIHDLPHELLQLIAAKLSIEDLRQLMLVSKRCRDAVQTDALWLSIYRRTWVMPPLLSWQQLVLLRCFLIKEMTLNPYTAWPAASQFACTGALRYSEERYKELLRIEAKKVCP